MSCYFEILPWEIALICLAGISKKIKKSIRIFKKKYLVQFNFGFISLKPKKPNQNQAH
jgi:hypothetical protein